MSARALLAAALVALLTACGGGGDDDSTAPVAPDVTIGAPACAAPSASGVRGGACA